MPKTNEEIWAVVLENEGIVKMVVNRFVKRHGERVFEEWMTDGYAGAHHAVKTFDPTRGMKLSSWMALVIEHALVNAWRNETRQDHKVRVGEDIVRKSIPFAFETETHPLGQGGHAGSGDNSDSTSQHDMPLTGLDPNGSLVSQPSFEDELVERIDTKDDFEKVSMAILSTLSEREQVVLHLHYFEGKTFEEIGRLQGGASRQRIDQIHKRAIAKVRAAIEIDASPSPDGGEGSSVDDTVGHSEPSAQPAGLGQDR